MNRFANQLVSFTKPASFAAEQYQNLRLKIERLRQTRDLRVIAITSPAAGPIPLSSRQRSRAVLRSADTGQPRAGSSARLDIIHS